ncbi:MAG: hydroxymethylglutaryl-CoA lyase [Bacteroidota bacterium]
MKIIECPRDAMQSWAEFIPTETKISYLNQLLRVGFDTLDFGSFVSPKAIPQMRDTAQVLEQLDLSETVTKLLVIVANLRGAETAMQHEEIEYVGFPLSVSETFQQRNTRKSIGKAIEVVQEIQNLCLKNNKKLVVYLSMGFGNPYGDPYNQDIISAFVRIMDEMKVGIIQLSDTIGISEPKLIREIFGEVMPRFPHMEIGAHFHSTPHTAYEKVQAAYQAGCRRFDGAIRGFGGCPMAKDDLTGNIATETILRFLEDENEHVGLDKAVFSQAMEASHEVFNTASVV